MTGPSTVISSSGSGSSAPFGLQLVTKDKSTSILYILAGLGEGPVYRINPNGVQDIKADGKYIDDLIDFDHDLPNGEVFQYRTRTGTITQPALSVFGNEVTREVRFASPVRLKSGLVSGIPESNVMFQTTNVTPNEGPIDAIRFKFVISKLKISDGEIVAPGVCNLAALVFPRNETVDINNYIAGKGLSVTATVEDRLLVDIEIPIPDAEKTSDGYRLSAIKISSDTDPENPGYESEIDFIGFDEIHNEKYVYPRTALIGYAVKATNIREGSLPQFTSLLKGLIVKVPNNYNQPILSNGDIDWREIEVPSSGADSAATRGYRLQQTNTTVSNSSTIPIYNGIWDGKFVYSWTQNPVWIIYDILTNTSYGLGIPESYIDKFNFYKVAQYCDACTTNGNFVGVAGKADGSYRYKPRGTYTSIEERLIGLALGTDIIERRFICDITISSQQSAVDLVQSICTSMRAVLNYGGGKIQLIADMPDALPVQIFNESNIIKDSIAISGIREEEIVTGVEVTYIEPDKNYERETIRIDDPNLLSDVNQIEKVVQVEAIGCTRRSQAVRFAQYILAANKYIRRRLSFSTWASGLDLSVGDIIAISQRELGTAYGYGGQIRTNSSIGANCAIYLEHYTTPAISNVVFTANTLPVGLRVFKRDYNKTDLYILSNTAYTLSSTSNVRDNSIDYISVVATKKFNPLTKTFDAISSFSSNNVPLYGDTWSLGEINTQDIYRSINDKLFRVDEVDVGDDYAVKVSASEYIANVYIDSETAINYAPVYYSQLFNPLQPPPPSQLTLTPVIRRRADGSVRYDIVVDASTDKTGFRQGIDTQLEQAYTTSGFVQVFGIN